jgi:hypothetical protein
MSERVQLVDLCEEKGITLKAKHERLVTREPSGLRAEWPHDEWHVTVSYQARNHSAVYKTGIGQRKRTKSLERQGGGYYDRMGDRFYRDDVDVAESGASKVTAPSVADVVCCLVSDASGADRSFADWCADYGYSDDSIKAHQTYLACQQTRDALIKLFGRALFDELVSAEH